MDNTSIITNEEFNEYEKRELWKQIAIAYTNASNSGYKDAACTWADYIVAEYEKRYLKEKH